MNKPRQNIKVQKWIAALAIVLLIIKVYAWYITQSVAILTDALESIVNVVAGLVGLYSVTLSSKPRDSDHPYGHGKIEFLTAALEGSCIMIVAFFILYKAVIGFWTPTPIQSLDFGLLLIAITGLVNYIAGLWCENIGHKNNSPVLISSGRHLKTDTYTTAGIIAGLILIYFTKITWIDSAVALFFALLILYTGFRIVRSSVSGIMDEADEKLLQNLVETLNKKRRINWIDLHNIRIIKYGAILHIDAHLTMPWYINLAEAHHEIDEVYALVLAEYGNSVEMFIHSDDCKPISCKICHKDDCTVRQFPFQKTIHWTAENTRTNNKHTVDTPTL